eukprot:gnl/Trimastix_PCT/4175.p1 GENE.gnl/Trimastix_PCT/4175~~gnl/Trimastix_PCT/4175.p1  ORF type:complete len:520 (+),score=133.19 gnl/Trimastix_PCT/4175:59-1618(+)
MLSLLQPLVEKELTCPICLGLIHRAVAVKTCLHRFCHECIIRYLRLGKKECPVCRAHLSSQRSLNMDPRADALIACVFDDQGGAEAYRAMSDETIAKVTAHLSFFKLHNDARDLLRRQLLARKGSHAQVHAPPSPLPLLPPSPPLHIYDLPVSPPPAGRPASKRRAKRPSRSARRTPKAVVSTPAPPEAPPLDGVSDPQESGETTDSASLPDETTASADSASLPGEDTLPAPRLPEHPRPTGEHSETEDRPEERVAEHMEEDIQAAEERTEVHMEETTEEHTEEPTEEPTEERTNAHECSMEIEAITDPTPPAPDMVHFPSQHTPTPHDAPAEPAPSPPARAPTKRDRKAERRRKRSHKKKETKKRRDTPGVQRSTVPSTPFSKKGTRRSLEVELREQARVRPRRSTRHQVHEVRILAASGADTSHDPDLCFALRRHANASLPLLAFNAVVAAESLTIADVAHHIAPLVGYPAADIQFGAHENDRWFCVPQTMALAIAKALHAPLGSLTLCYAAQETIL